MERLALLWDEFDDLVGAGAHLAGAAARELAGTAASMTSLAATVFAGLILLR